MTWLAYYPYLIAAHVMAVVFLVGGLLAQDQMLRVAAIFPQQRQLETVAGLICLNRRVITPALLLTWVFGLLLAMSAGWFTSRWLMLELIFVVALSGLHGLQLGRMRRCVGDSLSVQRIPRAGIGIVVVMLVIATLAFVKPF